MCMSKSQLYAARSVVCQCCHARRTSRAQEAKYPKRLTFTRYSGLSLADSACREFLEVQTAVLVQAMSWTKFLSCLDIRRGADTASLELMKHFDVLISRRTQ